MDKQICVPVENDSDLTCLRYVLDISGFYYSPQDKADEAEYVGRGEVSLVMCWPRREFKWFLTTQIEEHNIASTTWEEVMSYFECDLYADDKRCLTTT